MIREEQINRVARELLEPIEDNLGYDMSEFEHDVSIFKQGANWADNNPYWHKYPDEKPIIRQWYNIYLENDAVVSGYYGTDYIWYEPDMDVKIEDSYKSKVIAWIELPKPPKFD